MKKPAGYENWLTLMEAARLLGVTEAAVNYYRRNDKVVAVRVPVERESVNGNPERRQMWLIDPASLRAIFPHLP